MLSASMSGGKAHFDFDFKAILVQYLQLKRR